MSLQVIGPAGKGAKAVLWSETRMPRQTWSVDSQGRIRSQMFEDMILDVKGEASGLYTGCFPRDAQKWGVWSLQHHQTWSLPSSNLPLPLQVAEASTRTTPSFGTWLMKDPHRPGISRCCEEQRYHTGEEASDLTHVASQAPLSLWCEG